MNTSQAVVFLFGVEGKALRDKANSYVRNQTIPPSAVIAEGFSDASTGHRAKNQLTPAGVNCLFNALVLDAIFCDVKRVKGLIHSASARRESRALVTEILAQSPAHLCADSSAVTRFLSEFDAATFDPFSQRFTSPFAGRALPQCDIALKDAGLLFALLRGHRLRLSAKEEMLLFLLQGDLAAAASCAETLVGQADSDSDPSLNLLCHHVKRQYQDALAFESLLFSLPD